MYVSRMNVLNGLANSFAKYGDCASSTKLFAFCHCELNGYDFASWPMNQTLMTRHFIFSSASAPSLRKSSVGEKLYFPATCETPTTLPIGGRDGLSAATRKPTMHRMRRAWRMADMIPPHATVRG